MTNDQIRECPFCGEIEIIPQMQDIQDREGYPYAMLCTNCGAHGPWLYIQNQADFSPIIKAWNERYDR